MKVPRHPSYILHTRPYRETSLLIDLFSQHHGRCRVLAKGVRSRKSGRRGILMPFKPILVSWSGKGALPVLTAAESTAHLADMRGIYLHAGLYANELLLKLLAPFDPHPDLYGAYGLAIHRLASGGHPGEILRIFEKQLLGEIGYGLILNCDVDTGEEIDPAVEYRYVPESGPVISTQSVPSSLGIRGATLRDLDRESLPSSRSRSEARSLIRDLIERQLGDRALRSRRVFHQMVHYSHQAKNTNADNER